MTRFAQIIARRRVWLLLLLLALLFTSPYVIGLLAEWFRQIGGNNLPPVPGALLAILTFPFLLAYFAVMYLFSQAQTYLLISAMTLIACLLILWRGRVGRAARILTLLTMACVLAVPLVFRYMPNFAWLEERGYTLLAAPTRQTFVDETVDGIVHLLDAKACQHSILGWSADNILYYETACRFTPPALWRFDPAVPDSVQQVGQVTDNLVTEAETLLLPAMYAPTDHRSPDGRWIAAVWGAHDYDPEHVIIVSE